MKLRIMYLPLIVIIGVATLQMKPAHGAAADREKILEGAKKEGRLVLYTGMETDESSLFTKEFAKKYPFIKPEIFRASGEKVQARFMVEHRANTHLADIFQTSIVQVYQLKNAAMLARYVSAEAPAYAQGFKDAQGYWTAFYQIPYVIGYNSRMVASKDAPASYEDLLKPKWQGLISLETEEYQQNILRGLRRIPARSDITPDPPSLTQGLKLYPARPEGMIENFNETVARFDENFNKGR